MPFPSPNPRLQDTLGVHGHQSPVLALTPTRLETETPGVEVCLREVGREHRVATTPSEAWGLLA